MHDEYESLMVNGMWELTILLNNCTPIGSKWVFLAMTDALGHVVRYKARLLVKSFAQLHGVEFHETFVPIANFTTIRCILAI